MFFGASYGTTALFELLGAQGTNIILNESEEQLCIDVVARSENDGLNFLWEPKQGDPNELKDVAKSFTRANNGSESVNRAFRIFITDP